MTSFAIVEILYVVGGGSNGDMGAIYCSTTVGEPPSILKAVHSLPQSVPSRYINKLVIDCAYSTANLPNTLGH